MAVNLLKTRVREICSLCGSRVERTRRLFLEERAASLHGEREREYAIKRDISNYFSIPYSHIGFCGSAQLGISIHKERMFQPGVSDLDAACIDAGLYQKAWVDVIETSRAFTDATSFGMASAERIEAFERQVSRRGMIRVDAMPASKLKRDWTQFQGVLSRRHTDIFKSISLAIYINEYAFCWKQDSVLSRIME